MITIIDFGLSNLASVQNMLHRCDVLSKISSNPDEIAKADKLILPGVGSYDYAIRNIDDLGLREAIHVAVNKGNYLLGICLGAQLLMGSSEEGILSGLSLISGSCKKFDATRISPLRIPHMGWSEVHFRIQSHPINNFDEVPRFYFSHSYYIDCHFSHNILASCTYGIQYACAVTNDNIIGVQFHPEKSHSFGTKLLSNFAKM